MLKEEVIVVDRIGDFPIVKRVYREIKDDDKAIEIAKTLLPPKGAKSYSEIIGYYSKKPGSPALLTEEK